MREKARFKALQLFERAVQLQADSEYLLVAIELMNIAQNGGFYGYDIATGTSDRDAGKNLYGEAVNVDWIPFEGLMYTKKKVKAC